MQYFEQFEKDAGIGFWEYEGDWLRTDVITNRERATLIALCTDLRDYIDEHWDSLHDYKNSVRRIQQLGEYKEDPHMERNVAKYNAFYVNFLKKLNKIQIMLTTKKWIPNDFIFVELVNMINTFMPIHAEWFETVIHLIFMDYTKYRSTVDPDDNNTVILRGIIDNGGKIDEVRISKADYFNLLSCASPCVN